MTEQITNKTKPTLIHVDVNELQFIRQNAPTAFVRIVAEALTREGYPVDRVKVYKELHTIKDCYDSIIINKSRELLKAIANVDSFSFKENLLNKISEL